MRRRFEYQSRKLNIFKFGLKALSRDMAAHWGIDVDRAMIHAATARDLPDMSASGQPCCSKQKAACEPLKHCSARSMRCQKRQVKRAKKILGALYDYAKLVAPEPG